MIIIPSFMISYLIIPNIFQSWLRKPVSPACIEAVEGECANMSASGKGLACKAYNYGLRLLLVIYIYTYGIYSKYINSFHTEDSIYIYIYS